MKSFRKTGCKVIHHPWEWSIVNNAGYEYDVASESLFKAGADAWRNEIYRASNIQ